MFGVPLDRGQSAHILCDNESVVKNSTKLELVLNKKHNSIAYHYIQWNVAADVIQVGCISGKETFVDPLTKRLSAVARGCLFGNWTY